MVKIPARGPQIKTAFMFISVWAVKEQSAKNDSWDLRWLRPIKAVSIAEARVLRLAMFVVFWFMDLCAAAGFPHRALEGLHNCGRFHGEKQSRGSQNYKTSAALSNMFMINGMILRSRMFNHNRHDKNMPGNRRRTFSFMLDRMMSPSSLFPLFLCVLVFIGMHDQLCWHCKVVVAYFSPINGFRI